MSGAFVKAGPAARRAAALRKLDIAAITATGPRGWVMKSDVIAAAEMGRAQTGIALTKRDSVNATGAPYFHLTRVIEWRDGGSNATIIDAAFDAMRVEPRIARVWTAQRLFTPDTPAIVIDEFDGESTRRSRVSNTSHAMREDAAELKTDDCLLVTFITESAISQATILPPPGIGASLAVNMPSRQTVVRNGGVEAADVRSLTLTSDHRYIDGAVAASFMNAFAESVERRLR